jgi:hypothetical protein
MAKILILAKSGFGKTNSYCGRDLYGITGLSPSNSYVIQCINRNLPNPNFKLTELKLESLPKGNRVQVGNIEGMEKFNKIADTIEFLANSPYKNIVLDDFNYPAQDFYMSNAMKGGWDRVVSSL